MNWLSNITPPGIKNIFKKQDDKSDSLWLKCSNCGDMIFHRDIEVAHRVCPSCGHHMILSPEERLKLTFDDQKFTRIDLPKTPADPLKFRDTKKYSDRLKEHRKRTGEQDALIVAHGTVEAVPSVIAIQNFAFMGGSMGMAVGEGFVAAAEKAIELSAPLIMFTASGGARMQESILALMQMPRTTIAVEMLRDAGLPFIVVLTNPTTGGVMASFAMLGDIHIAEPGALIGFAGRRVIEQTIREKLPGEFQKAEFLLEKGMVDIVCHRHDMRAVLGKLVRTLMNSSARGRQNTPADISEVETQKPIDGNTAPIQTIEDKTVEAKTVEAKTDEKKAKSNVTALAVPIKPIKKLIKKAASSDDGLPTDKAAE